MAALKMCEVGHYKESESESKSAIGLFSGRDIPTPLLGESLIEHYL